MDISKLLKEVKLCSYALANLSTTEKNKALEAFAQEISLNKSWLFQENQKDLSENKGKLSPQLYSRLELTELKLDQLVEGLRDVIRLEDPTKKVLLERQLDDGLILQKISVPIGVLAIIFESRPDVIPQILSLALKSGNAVVLKGGSEAKHSNEAFMKLVQRVTEGLPFLPQQWAQLVDGREAVHEVLKYPQYVDLVIPRGSNELVQKIQQSTKIPVLGHADGICHLYVHETADLALATKVTLDSKTQSPTTCNAVETLLVDRTIASTFLPDFWKQVKAKGVVLKGCAATKGILPDIEAATEQDWKTEYGDLRLSVKVVGNLSEAIQHINGYGSHHTDGIFASLKSVQEHFLEQVDSACVFVNASLRFTDGFRFGFGAEVGISTNKTHARGPVGLEGLVIYKYKVRGSGQVVADYVGPKAKPFQHKDL
ncbi:MAG: glutamate-5-semialdehyde dehydrogenase [Bdellovibrionales bacterium]